MYFPIAGIEVAWYIPILATFCISFFTSMAGMSGAFLILPFQVEVLGYTNPSVSATNQCYNLTAIPNSLLRYAKEKRFYRTLCYDLAIGAVPGVLLGALVRAFVLNEHDDFRIYTAIILSYLSYRMLKDSFSEKLSNKKLKDPYSLKDLGTIDGRAYFSFDGEKYSYSRKHLLITSAVVSFFGSIYGIGSGAFLAPFLLSFYKLPVYISAAGMLFTTITSSLISVISFTLFALFYADYSLMPDFKLALLLGIGGIMGMSLGTRHQKNISARKLNMLIAILLLIATIVTLKPLFQ